MADAKHRPITLLMTADTVGGVWTYALELVRGLQSFGLQVHLATMGKMPTAAQFKAAGELANLHLHPSSYQLEWMDDPWEEVSAAGEWLLELEKKIKPDLIHLNNYCHGDLPWQAPVLMVGHSCVLSWWQAVKAVPAPERYAPYWRRVKEGLQAANLVVAPTSAFLEQLQHYYGPFLQDTVIPNCRAAEGFNPRTKEHFILSVGRLWDEAKNMAACDGAAEGLVWPIKIAGEAQHPGGGAEKEYQHLELLGSLSPQEVATTMGNAAIYLLPAKYEPFGLSVLEAAHSGCALVLGDIPSLRENWEGAALFVDPDEPAAIREKLDFLIRHPKTRLRLGALAAERASGFTPAVQAKAYVAQYRHLLDEAQPEPLKNASLTL